LVFGRSDCGQGGESFRPPFSKGGAVKGAEPLSRSAERETPFRRFLFAALRSKVCFSLCAYMVKEKASFGIVLFWGDNTFCLQPEPTEKTTLVFGRFFGNSFVFTGVVPVSVWGYAGSGQSLL